MRVLLFSNHCRSKQNWFNELVKKPRANLPLEFIANVRRNPFVLGKIIFLTMKHLVYVLHWTRQRQWPFSIAVVQCKPLKLQAIKLSGFSWMPQNFCFGKIMRNTFGCEEHSSLNEKTKLFRNLNLLLHWKQISINLLPPIGSRHSALVTVVPQPHKQC